MGTEVVRITPPENFFYFKSWFRTSHPVTPGPNQDVPATKRWERTWINPGGVPLLRKSKAQLSARSWEGGEIKAGAVSRHQRVNG